MRQNWHVHGLDQHFAGAGLGVYTDEPNVPKWLLHLDNAVLLPHLAGATHSTRRAMADLVFENLAAFFKTSRVMVLVSSAT